MPEVPSWLKELKELEKTCYFLLNYALEKQLEEARVGETGLLFSFELCVPSDSTNAEKVYKVVTCYFLLNYANRDSIPRGRRRGSPACYFLLNYA